MKILVVDDEEAVRELVKDAMLARGHRVWVAANSRQALDLAGEFEFDLVFFDVMIDGKLEVEALRAFGGMLRPQSEIVLMTGQESVEAAIEAVGHGANDYICKPFSIGVIQAIAIVVEQRSYPGKPSSGVSRTEDPPPDFVSTTEATSAMNDFIPEGEMPTLEQLESSYLLRVLSAVGGNKSRAAQVMGVDRKTLYRMIDRQIKRRPENRKVSQPQQ